MFPSFVITNLMKNMIVLSIGVFESKERVFIAIGFPLSGHLLPLFAPSFIF